MTCLTVKSSIQPTSRPTGTDDDMGGNDKADALAGSNLERTKTTRRSAQLPLNRANSARHDPFMASPAPDCTCGEPEKGKVWPNGDSGAPRGFGR
jgi:hypothetical protein